MASPLLFPICVLLVLRALRERLRSTGRFRAAAVIGWLTTACVVLLPVLTMTALLEVAPGYLQSMAAGSDGKWLFGGAVFAQIAFNFLIKKIIDFSFQRIVDLKV
jgi:Flp pilus assembly protein TadB